MKLPKIVLTLILMSSLTYAFAQNENFSLDIPKGEWLSVKVKYADLNWQKDEENGFYTLIELNLNYDMPENYAVVLHAEDLEKWHIYNSEKKWISKSYRGYTVQKSPYGPVDERKFCFLQSYYISNFTEPFKKGKHYLQIYSRAGANTTTGSPKKNMFGKTSYAEANKSFAKEITVSIACLSEEALDPIIKQVNRNRAEDRALKELGGGSYPEELRKTSRSDRWWVKHYYEGWALASTTGGRIELLTDFKYEYINDFHDGLAIVSVDLGRDDYDNSRYGAINFDGVEVIPTKCRLLNDFNHGLAPFNYTKYQKYGYFDTNGKIVFKPQFEYAASFNDNGLASVKLNDKYGFIDTLNNIVISFKYKYSNKYFRQGLVAVAYDNDKFGCINAKGKTIIPFQFDKIIISHEVDLVAVKKSGKWGFMNTKGRLVVPHQYDDISSFGGDKLLCGVEKNGKWGFVDTKGQLVISHEYDDVDEFGFGNSTLCAVKKSGKWGFINENGELIIPFRYESIGIGGFDSRGVCEVRFESYLEEPSLIDMKGNIVE